MSIYITQDQVQLLELGEVIMKQFLPVYYMAERPTSLELKAAVTSWNLVEGGMCPAFMEDQTLTSNAASLYKTCLEYYCDIFFDSLYEVDPHLRTLINSDSKHGMKWIMNILNTILDSINDELEFTRQVQRIARHNKKKRNLCVRDFGLIGEMTFFALGKVLRDDYTYDTHMAWIKIFSWVLRIMIPTSLVEILRQHTRHSDRIPLYGDFNRIMRKVTEKGNKKSSPIKKFFRSMLSWRSNGIYAIDESETYYSEISDDGEPEFII